MAGRPRKNPNSIAGKRQEAPLQLVPRGLEPPPAPTGLLSRSRELWDRYWRSAIAANVERASADLAPIERWIRYCDEWDRAFAGFRRERLVEGSTGQQVASPLWRVLMDLEGKIRGLESELGMTPLARARLGWTIKKLDATDGRASMNAFLAEGVDDEAAEGETEPAWEPL